MTLTEIDIFSKGGAVRSLLAGLSSACGERTDVALRWTEGRFLENGGVGKQSLCR